MAHEILSVKLCELDEKISRMHSRIHLSESTGRGQLEQEIAALKRECAETELTLRNRLRFSKSGAVSALSQAYDEIRQIIIRTSDDLQKRGADRPDESAPAEEKILLAEYALDFAMQASDRALLLSMEAIDAQMAQPEQEEGSLS